MNPGNGAELCGQSLEDPKEIQGIGRIQICCIRMCMAYGFE